MAKRVTFIPRLISILDVSAYHADAESSLGLYFSRTSPTFSIRFTGYLSNDVITELAARLEETDLRSSLAILTRLEAVFRKDFLFRCQTKKRDSLSRAFRDLYKQKQINVSLEDDIFETWRQVHPEFKEIIGDLKGAFKFRHWLAHGSYWTPKLGRKYDYLTVYAIADAVFAGFPLYR